MYKFIGWLGNSPLGFTLKLVTDKYYGHMSLFDSFDKQSLWLNQIAFLDFCYVDDEN